MTSNPFLSLDQQIVGDIYTSTETMDNLTVLCDDFGARFAGTPEERQAAEFIKAKLESYGLSNVHFEPVDYLGWKRGEASLEIISPIQKTIPCISLPQSPPVNGLEAALIDMGEGAPDDFDKRAAEIKGKIVMANSVIMPTGVNRWIHRKEKLSRSQLAGAGAFIFVNHYPGYGPATGSAGHRGKASLIPAIGVAKEDGDFLSRLLKRHGNVTLRLTTTDELAPATSWNIVAELPGGAQAEQVVMLGCHYDGHDISQGAEDPASGTVALMEAGRVLAKYAKQLPCTVRFVFWGIEEIGLLGSKAYALAHADELSNIRFYLNMDSAGAMDYKDIALNMWPELEATFTGYSQQMALDFALKQSVHAHSDHYPFFMAGVPTGGIEQVRIQRAGRGYGHTRYDTLDKVNIRNLREAAVLSARLALRIASDSAWPVSCRTPEAVQAILDSPDHQAELDYNARLDAMYEAVGSKEIRD